MADYHYYPWVRTGNARLLTAPDDPAATDRPVRGTVALTAWITTDDTNPPVKLPVELYGPGDVIGLDARQVIRTDPPPHATDFEPNLFPLIEFYWPDLPWFFTPAAPAPNDRLRPWLCLVVVTAEGNPLSYVPGQRLPVLTVANPAAELPDLSQSWAWAHAQVTGDVPPNDEGQLLAGVSDRTLSRLVCPRKLAQNTAYRGCVVPAFDIGRRVGLGLPVDDKMTLSPAWQAATPGQAPTLGPLELPVYYHWEFSTGPAGDFEALMWELRPRDAPENAGYRSLPVRPPTGDWPGDQEAVLGSALRPLGAARAGGVSTEWRAELVKLLNAHEDLQDNMPLPPGMPLPPPFYASWHAAQRKLPDEGAAAGPANAVWLRDLNLDPGLRAAAGLGAQVVREQQEALMASAWDQLGDIERVNEALRNAQLAMEVGRRIYAQHLLPLAPETLLALTGPVHARVREASGNLTVRGAINASCLPVAATGGAFRRLTRSRGPLGRRANLDQARTGSLLIRAAQPGSPLAPPRKDPGGLATGARLDLPSLCTLLEKDIAEVGRPVDEQPPFQETREAFIKALSELQASLRPFCAKPPAPCAAFDIGAARNALVTGLNPLATVPARVGARIKLPAGRVLDPTLDPLRAYPVFPQPMYRPLAALSQDFLLSGIENIPPDTILLLDTNPAFMEAFMAGLNDEMGRELLWRGFPTDQRGSYFRRFWDPQSNLGSDQQDTWDITELHTWGPEDGLGTHRPKDATQPAVLLIRGRLLQRFPNAVIYAAPAEIGADGKRVPKRADESWPIFQATLPPDMTFLGFDVSADTMRGSDDRAENRLGWFIILQQQPSQPRYGLDATRPAQLTGTWNDLSWEDVPVAGSHVNLAGSLDPAFAPPTAGLDAAIQWGPTLTSAGLAYMTLQTPARVAIHASDLLPEG